jgi:ribose 5-phosphate isomerase B
MKVVLISDHAGFNLRKILEKHIGKLGFDVTDLGTPTPDAPTDDYPHLAAEACEKIVAGSYDRGIFICGTGIGMTISANKVPGIRAAVCNDLFSAQKSRQHNNANVCGLGARIIGAELAKDIVGIWLSTDFEGGRHAARMQLITDLENRYSRESPHRSNE